MEDYRTLLPNETSEYDLFSVEKLRKIESDLRFIFSQNGYQEVIPPIFEFVELYQKLELNFEQEKMFQFIHSNGGPVALRYDFTVPLARKYATAMQNDLVARYCYFGQVYRKEKRHKGRRIEMFQSGIELFNQTEFEGNVECLNLALKTLQVLPCHSVVLELGSVTFFKCLRELAGEKGHELEKILERKDVSALKKLTNQIQVSDELKVLFSCLLTGSENQLKQAVMATKNEKLISSVKDLEKIKSALDSEIELEFDLAMVPSMSYYTGLIFKVYSKGAAQEIITGGRYDHLLTKFNQKKTAIGFCCQLDQILKGGE